MSTYQGVPIRRIPPGEGGADRQVVWRVAHEIEAHGPPTPRISAPQGFARYVTIRVHYERQRGEVAGYWSCVKDILDRALRHGVDALTPQQAKVLDSAKVQAHKWITEQ